MLRATFLAVAIATAIQLVGAACTSNASSTDELQTLLQNGGEGYTLSLCSGQTYNLSKILNYTAASQVSYHSSVSPRPAEDRKYRLKDIRETRLGRRC